MQINSEWMKLSSQVALRHKRLTWRECRGWISQQITCKIDTTRKQNSLLILTSCLFVSFNTQDMTFRCTAAVSRSVTGGADVNKQLRTGLSKQKVWRNLQPNSDIKHVGVFNFSVPGAKDPVWKIAGHKGSSAASGGVPPLRCSTSTEAWNSACCCHFIYRLSVLKVRHVAWRSGTPQWK